MKSDLEQEHAESAEERFNQLSRQQNWKMKRDRLSPCYTTDPADILQVKI